MIHATKYKFGYTVHAYHYKDVLDEMKLAFKLTLCRLDQQGDHKDIFAGISLMELGVQSLQLEKGTRKGNYAVYGIEPICLPESFFDGNRQITDKIIPQHDWVWLERVELRSHVLTISGAAQCLELVGKVLLDAQLPSVDYAKPAYAPLITCWVQLDMFSRICAALQAHGIKRIDGALQNYQSWHNTQMDAAHIARLYRNSELLRMYQEKAASNV